MNVHNKIVFFVQVLQLGSSVHGELKQNVGITLNAFSVKGMVGGDDDLQGFISWYGDVPYFKFGILLGKFYVIRVE